MLPHHAFLRHLGCIRKIHSTKDRLPIQCNSGRLQRRIDFARIERSYAVVPFSPDTRDLPTETGSYGEFRCCLPSVLSIVSLITQRLPWERKCRFTAAGTETEQHRGQRVACCAGV